MQGHAERLALSDPGVPPQTFFAIPPHPEWPRRIGAPAVLSARERLEEGGPVRGAERGGMNVVVRPGSGIPSLGWPMLGVSRVMQRHGTLSSRLIGGHVCLVRGTAAYTAAGGRPHHRSRHRIVDLWSSCLRRTRLPRQRQCHRPRSRMHLIFRCILRHAPQRDHTICSWITTSRGGTTKNRAAPRSGTSVWP